MKLIVFITKTTSPLKLRKYGVKVHSKMVTTLQADAVFRWKPPENIRNMDILAKNIIVFAKLSSSKPISTDPNNISSVFKIIFKEYCMISMELVSSGFACLIETDILFAR
nr:hypothetical protein [Paenibacillus wynnii]